jgi:5-formyltetrahydrofolate cyclo-ligase
MFFSKWSLNEPLKVNRYGFLEPVIYKRIRNPNVILIPLLAYDRLDYILTEKGIL